jgi:hypothetical protein
LEHYTESSGNSTENVEEIEWRSERYHNHMIIRIDLPADDKWLEYVNALRPAAMFG